MLSLKTVNNIYTMKYFRKDAYYCLALLINGKIKILPFIAMMACILYSY
jgi:hypothetical protein